MDTSWIPSLRDIEHFLVTPSGVRAIVVSLIMSWAGTQWFKVREFLLQMPARYHKLTTRVIAFGLAYLPCVVLWPDINRWIFAPLVAFAAPFVYTIVMRILYKFFPWLVDKVSAEPKLAENRVVEDPIEDYP